MYIIVIIFKVINDPICPNLQLDLTFHCECGCDDAMIKGESWENI